MTVTDHPADLAAPAVRQAPRTDRSDPAWLAYHVFYASDSNPIIVEAIRPLVARLRDAGTIDGWFFIKYWMDGPHVRLRVRPRHANLHAEVDREVVDALEAFLARRPALYETNQEIVGDLYKDMFLAEYSQDEWDEKYGAEGEMPLQPNNTVVRYPYEPEHDRYGGPAGVRIAEWHFEQSSDLVATLLATSNPHVRPVLLGLATQLSMMSAFVFLEQDDAVARFFERYRRFWETNYEQDSSDYHEKFDTTLQTCGTGLRAATDRIRAAAAGETDRLPPFERAWLEHCTELRARVTAAAAAGDLTFPQGSSRAAIDDPEALATVLLSSYVHMTNNRLGVAILDEIYLSYLIQQSLTRPRVEAG